MMENNDSFSSTCAVTLKVRGQGLVSLMHIRRNTNVGRKVVCTTADILHQFQGQRSRSPGRLTPWLKFSRIFRMGRPASHHLQKAAALPYGEGAARPAVDPMHIGPGHIVAATLQAAQLVVFVFQVTARWLVSAGWSWAAVKSSVLQLHGLFWKIHSLYCLTRSQSSLCTSVLESPFSAILCFRW